MKLTKDNEIGIDFIKLLINRTREINNNNIQITFHMAFDDIKKQKIIMRKILIY